MTAGNNELAPAWAVGAKVRIRPGTPDPDFPDIPIGGWAGYIAEIDRSGPQPLYLVAWSDETLEGIPPIFLRRSDRLGLDTDRTWLPASVLVADDGSPLAMEKPDVLTPPPLDDDIAEDRVRRIFGLTADDDLPAPDAEGLRKFHEHLSRRLRFPIPLAYQDEDGLDAGPTEMIAVRLLPMSETSMETGIRVEVADGDAAEVLTFDELPTLEGSPTDREVEAYRVWWFGDDTSFADAIERRVGQFLTRAATTVAALMIFLGALAGAAYRVLPEAVMAAQVGAALGGIILALVGAQAERLFRSVNRLAPGVLAGIFLGGLVGAFFGAAAGVIVPCYVGAIPGAMAGTLLGSGLTAVGVKNVRTFRLTMFGLYIGAGAYLVWTDAAESARGAMLGACVGAGVALIVGVWVVLTLVLWGRRG